MRYTARPAKELSIGQSANGTGRRTWIKGAYVIDPTGRKVRAFTDREGGLEAAVKWAQVLNERYGR